MFSALLPGDSFVCVAWWSEPRQTLAATVLMIVDLRAHRMILRILEEFKAWADEESVLVCFITPNPKQ